MRNALSIVRCRFDEGEVSHLFCPEIAHDVIETTKHLTAHRRGAALHMPSPPGTSSRSQDRTTTEKTMPILWYWFLLGLLPYHIERQERRNMHLFTFFALLWQFTFTRQGKQYYWSFSLPWTMQFQRLQSMHIIFTGSVTKMIQEILKTLLLLFQQSCRLHALVYVKKDR